MIASLIFNDLHTVRPRDLASDFPQLFFLSRQILFPSPDRLIPKVVGNSILMKFHMRKGHSKVRFPAQDLQAVHLLIQILSHRHSCNMCLFQSTRQCSRVASKGCQDADTAASSAMLVQGAYRDPVGSSSVITSAVHNYYCCLGSRYDQSQM